MKARLRQAWVIVSTLGWPWRRAAAAEASTGNAIRCSALAAGLRRWPRLLRPFARLAMLLCWPIASLAEALSLHRAVPAQSRAGRTPLQLTVWSWLHALRHSVAPVEALAYRQHQPEAAAADDWIYSSDYLFLIRELTAPAVIELCSDKRAFADWCVRQGLAAIPTLGAASAGRWDNDALPELPARDLLLKPRRGAQGAGIEVWRATGDRFQRGGTTLDADGLRRHVLVRSVGGVELLVQPCLRPADWLRPVAGSGMPAVRVISTCDRAGHSRIATALLQAPLPGAAISQSGPFRLIDVVTGAVLPATARQASPVFDNPLGEDFPECALPDWSALMSGLCRAHAALPGQAPVIGWDLLFTDQGPRICEANIFISFYFFQLAAGPLAPTEVGRVLAERFR